MQDEKKTLTFSNGTSVDYTTEDGGQIFISEIFQFSPYKGLTLKDALDQMDFASVELKKLDPKKLDDVCYDFGDNSFKKEYRREMGSSSGAMAAAIANLWHREWCDSPSEWMENGKVVAEDWCHFDCISVDPDLAADDEEYFLQEKNYVLNLMSAHPHFSEYLQPILEEMEELNGHTFFVIQYGFSYGDF